MARVVVEVMPKPEILDPQGKAVTGALARLGFEGLTVRQGKRFEIEVDGELDDARLAQVHDAAERLLANTVIEAFVVQVPGAAQTADVTAAADAATDAAATAAEDDDVTTEIEVVAEPGDVAQESDR